MNAFAEHHQDSIRFQYRCFDRMLLNGTIQLLQQPERVVGFFNAYRHQYPVTRTVLRGIANEYHAWVTQRARVWRVPIVAAPKGRRDEFVERYFRQARPDRIIVILKAREPARILTARGKEDRWHLTFAQQWVNQYNFYINDRDWGRLFVRICPYFPFAARICLNQHHWLASQLRAEGVAFHQSGNAFLRCAEPTRLQVLADALQPHDLARVGDKWLKPLTPFFTASERRVCGYRVFAAQVEYCDNLIFRRRATLDRLGDRLFDANRTIGQPNKLTAIFGRKVTRRYGGLRQTVIEDLNFPNPVIRSYYRHGSIKQYVRDHLLLRTEPVTNDVSDYGLKKALDQLPALRTEMSKIIDGYHNVQQDILETFVDRGHFRRLAEPTGLSNGKRLPGLKVDHPRQLALMHALVRFAHLAANATFTTADLLAPAVKALGETTRPYTLASLRYELAKLRAKGLVEKLPHSRRYHLQPSGYRICLIFLKLFERVHGPLTAGLLQPCPGDRRLPEERRTQLDRLYQQIAVDLDKLLGAVGLHIAA
jgi:hypothetical protein